MQFNNNIDMVNAARQNARQFTGRPKLPTNEHGYGQQSYVVSLVSVNAYDPTETSSGRLEFQLCLHKHGMEFDGCIYRVVQWINEDVQVDANNELIKGEDGRAITIPGSFNGFVIKMNSLIAHMGLSSVVWTDFYQLTACLQAGRNQFLAEIITRTVVSEKGSYQNHTLGFVKKLS